MEVNGTTYDSRTPAAVITALESARANGTRIRLWLGDANTGKAWAEEYDVIGTISRSMGPMKIPLLIHSRRSMGGGGILTACIVAIKSTAGRWLYRHPSFDPGAYTLRPCDHPDGYTREALDAEGVHARFKSETRARNWAAFMVGDRFAA